jgi:hypothetical protein
MLGVPRQEVPYYISYTHNVLRCTYTHFIGMNSMTRSIKPHCIGINSTLFQVPQTHFTHIHNMLSHIYTTCLEAPNHISYTYITYLQTSSPLHIGQNMRRLLNTYGVYDGVILARKVDELIHK